MSHRPELPELPYLLWVPALGLYVQTTGQRRRRFTGTVHRERAACLLFPQAREVALQVIRHSGHAVELRDVQPATGSGL